MHKLAKGLKKKKKSKKGKKGEEEEEFEREELERYRRERAEAQERAAEESGSAGERGERGEPSSSSTASGSDEWRKFEALTKGVDSILRKTQGDLDRIKSTSFFQRKPPLLEERVHDKPEEGRAGEEGAKSGKWVGFDEEGNPIEREPLKPGDGAKDEGPLLGEDGIVHVPEDEDEREDSADEDIFDTTYVDVLQNIDVQLAYIPDSPTQEELGDDPFDTTNADKVLKTVDKKGNKLVSLGNAVEVLAGRIDHVSTCKLTGGKGKRARVQQDLLLDDFEEHPERSGADGTEVTAGTTAEKTLLDEDDDLPDVPVDLTSLPAIVNLPRAASPSTDKNRDRPFGEALDISEFEPLGRERTILEEIPDLEEAELELGEAEAARLEEAEDPFAEKGPLEASSLDFRSEIIEASFEAATFVNEEDPFDTSFAENILPGKTELKFIERELEELPVSEVTISLTDPAGLDRNYETGLLQPREEQKILKKDLLAGSTTDLTRLADQPINPLEEITYVDPFDTSAIQEPLPGRAELKVLEEELLGEESNQAPQDIIDDDDFDPRKEEQSLSKVDPAPPIQPSFTVEIQEEQIAETEENIEDARGGRKPSRPEALPLEANLLVNKSVAFELPTPSNRPDLLTTSEEEKALRSKPLTPYHTQKSIEEVLPAEENEQEEEVDPFDTSFVSKLAPGKTELKLIESELLSQEEPISRGNLSDEDFDPRGESEVVVEEIEGQGVVLSRQETLLDAEVEVDAKPLTPRVESKVIASQEPEGISYADPFDTSIATNILPGKAELRILEKELESIVEAPPIPKQPEILLKASVVVASPPRTAVLLEDDEDFDPRAEDTAQTQDFLSLDGEDPGDKVLTPIQDHDKFAGNEDIDPFDTSFAAIGPGKAELKLLESELMEN